MIASIALGLAAGLVVSPAPAQGSVWVVDQASGPGADFTTIHAAIAAAKSGDGILVRSGDYFETIAFGSVAPKSLVIAEEAGADARAVSVFVRDLPAAETFVVRGIDLEPLPQNDHVTLLDCAGDVWLEDVAGIPGLGGNGALISDCASVVLARCEFSDNFFGGEGSVTIQRSRVAIFDSTLRPGANATYGVDAFASQVLVSGGSIEGRDGADAIPGDPCTPATPGGAALRLWGAGAELELVGGSLAGGHGGAGAGGACPAAPDGPDVEVLAGTVRRFPGRARSLEVPSSVSTPGTCPLTFRGEPGDRAYLLAADAVRPGTPSGSTTGWSVVEAQHRPLLLGVVPPAGVLEVDVPLGAVPGTAGTHVFFQGIALSRRPVHALRLGTTPGRVFISSPGALLIVPSGP